MKPALPAALLSLLALPVQAGSRDEVLAADRAFSKLSVAKGSAYAFWFNVARDGRLYGSSGPPTIGKAAAAKDLPTATDMHQTVLSWEPTAAGANDRLGWTDGRWSQSGPHGTIRGHYLTVWVKEDGQWKVQADMGTTDSGSKH
jgi:hypothetical protein